MKNPDLLRSRKIFLILVLAIAALAGCGSEETETPSVSETVIFDRASAEATVTAQSQEQETADESGSEGHDTADQKDAEAGSAEKEQNSEGSEKAATDESATDESGTDESGTGESGTSEGTTPVAEPTPKPTPLPKPSPTPSPTPTPTPTSIVPRPLNDQIENNFGISEQDHQQLIKDSPSETELRNTTLTSWPTKDGKHTPVTLTDGVGQVDGYEVTLVDSIPGLEYLGTPATAISFSHSNEIMGSAHSAFLVDNAHNILTEIKTWYFHKKNNTDLRIEHLGSFGNFLVGGAGPNLVVSASVVPSKEDFSVKYSAMYYRVDLSTEKLEVKETQTDYSCQNSDHYKEPEDRKTLPQTKIKTYAGPQTPVRGPDLEPGTEVVVLWALHGRLELQIEPGVCLWARRGDLVDLDYQASEIPEGVVELSGETIMGIPLAADINLIAEALQPVLGKAENIWLDGQQIGFKFGDSLEVTYPMIRYPNYNLNAPLTWTYQGGFDAIIDGDLMVSDIETVKIADIDGPGDEYIEMRGSDTFMRCNIDKKICIQLMPSWSEVSQQLLSCAVCATEQTTATVVAKRGPVNVRNGPGLSYDIIAETYPDYEVTVFAGKEVADNYTWRQIAFDGHLGYMADEFLEISEN